MQFASSFLKLHFHFCLERKAMEYDELGLRFTRDILFVQIILADQLKLNINSYFPMRNLLDFLS